MTDQINTAAIPPCRALYSCSHNRLNWHPCAACEQIFLTTLSRSSRPSVAHLHRLLEASPEGSRKMYTPVDQDFGESQEALELGNPRSKAISNTCSPRESISSREEPHRARSYRWPRRPKDWPYLRALGFSAFMTNTSIRKLVSPHHFSPPSQAHSAISSWMKKTRTFIPQTRWQKAALGFSIAAFLTFTVNVIFVLWATIARRDTLENGIGIISEQGCSCTKGFNTGIHVVINIMSTILLAGSNYCMQCLIAPTRSDRDKAHAKEKWLDIGVPSMRNMWSISRKRRLLWLLLSASSFPLHLL